MEDYIREIKKGLEERIPDFESADFRKITEKIRKELEKKESEYLILIRRIKILVLGDWHTQEKRERLNTIKNTLLKNGLYAQTIDRYYDLNKSGALSQQQILEFCAVNHQIIVFIDGSGTGTVTEQNYLAENYLFHGKIIFFIEEPKFDKLKGNPSEYIKSFPTIITYNDPELYDKVLTYSRLRVYRLAGIIEKQSNTGKGLHNPKYQPWEKRLKGDKLI